MSDEIRDALAEVKLLRDLVGRLVEHLASGGRVDRFHKLFGDFKRVHRSTRASNSALEQLEPVYRLREVWQVLADSMLETGGAELTEAACTIARELGIELRVSEDGGKTFKPFTIAKGKPGEFWDHLCAGRGQMLMAERIRLSAYEVRCNRCGLQPGHGVVESEQYRARKGENPRLYAPAGADPEFLDELEPGDINYITDERIAERLCSEPGCGRPAGEGGLYCDEHAIAVQAHTRAATIRNLQFRNERREPGSPWWHWCRTPAANDGAVNEVGVLVMPGAATRCPACQDPRPLVRDRSTAQWIEG